MPRLLMFGACQKAIIDKQDGTVSMIALVAGVRVLLPKEQAIPANAATPLHLATVAYWLKTPEDEGKTFEQRLEIVSPRGGVMIQALLPFTLTGQTHSNAIDMDTFPVGDSGVYGLRLSLREVSEDTEHEWQVVTEYPFSVDYQMV